MIAKDLSEFRNYLTIKIILLYHRYAEKAISFPNIILSPIPTGKTKMLTVGECIKVMHGPSEHTIHKRGIVNDIYLFCARRNVGYPIGIKLVVIFILWVFVTAIFDQWLAVCGRYFVSVVLSHESSTVMLPLTVWTVLTQGCIMKAQPYRRCLISITVQRADFEDWLC